MKTWQWVAVGAGAVIVISLINRKRVMSNLKTVQLSENFNLSEFVVTSTGFENIPGDAEVASLKALCVNVLQPMRNGFVKKYPGKKVSVVITSGFRSELVNKAIGGADTSQHKYGEAGDFHVLVDGVKLRNSEVIQMIMNLALPYDQIIDEQLKGKEWVHVSHRSASLRREYLTARDGANGKAVYKTISKG